MFLFNRSEFMSINGSFFRCSKLENKIPQTINIMNTHQRIVLERDNKNKINPKTEMVNRKIPKKSMRFNSKVKPLAFGSTNIAKLRPMIIIGMLIKNIEGQCHSAIRNPPIVGPNAAEVDEKTLTIAIARACFLVICARTILIPLGNNVELPIACKARQPSNIP